MKCARDSVILLFLLMKTAVAEKRIWKHNALITNPENWVPSEYSSPCEGLQFPRYLQRSVSLNSKLSIKQITLPSFGLIVLESNSSLVLTTKSQECIEIEPYPRHDWTDAANWKPSSANNKATPDLERIPCEYDDIVFPNTSFHCNFPDVEIKVKSMIINNVKLSQEDFQEEVLRARAYFEDFYADFEMVNVELTNAACLQKSGCVCQQKSEILDTLCASKPSTVAHCMDPLGPEGFCGDICGAVVHVEVTSAFNIENFKKTIPKYKNSDTYVSKVLKDGKEMVQIVFADKTDFYQASSPQNAEEFHYSLLRDLAVHNIKTSTLLKSGVPYYPEGNTTSIMAIIFSTLLTCIVIFMVIYYVYNGPMGNVQIPLRFNFTARQAQFIPKSFTFACFDNKDGGGLSFDNSMAGSIISLEKAFDNPLYGTQLPSTSGTLEDISAEETTMTESEIKNPLYAEDEKKIKIRFPIIDVETDLDKLEE